MTFGLFMTLLSAFSVITGLTTNATKKVLDDKKVKYSSNVLAVSEAIIIGSIGTGTYYQLTCIPFTTNNIIYMILMGLSSGVVAMVGYDKFKQTIEQINTNK
jgi:predicted MFS family arabinose efflux permease